MTTHCSLLHSWSMAGGGSKHFKEGNLHCSSGQELSEEQFAYGESLLVPSSERGSSPSLWLKQCPQCLKMYFVILGTIAPGRMGSFGCRLLCQGRFCYNVTVSNRMSQHGCLAQRLLQSSSHITLELRTYHLIYEISFVCKQGKKEKRALNPP